MAAVSIEPFVEYLHQLVPLSPAEVEVVRDLLPVKYFPKGHHLLREGEVSNAFFFLLQGCVRMFYLVDGQDKNTFFYQEQQFISSYESFVRQVPSPHSIQCVEDCAVVIISQQAAQQLLMHTPTFDQLSRILLEEELIVYQQMLASFITMSAEQRYQTLMQTQPDLLQRLPQYHIASYLGVNAETLSRIRRRLSDKKKLS